MKEPLSFSFSNRQQRQDFKDKLLSLFRTEYIGSGLETITFHDTFDWRFFHHNFEFCRYAGKYFLIAGDSGEIRYSIDWPGNKVLKNWKQLPAGKLRNLTADIMENRCLIPLTELSQKTETYKFVNGAGLNAAVLHLEYCFYGEIEICSCARIIPQSGKPDEITEIAEFCALNKLEPFSGFWPRLTPEVFEAMNIEPCWYESKPITPVTRDMTCRHAAIMLCKDMFDVVKQNEDGIKEDIDIEFLHDFRVSLRRTRSLLTLLRGAFPMEQNKLFKRRIGEIARNTNKLRDFDVLLSYRHDYKSMVPPELRDGLKAFFKQVSARRRKEYRKTVNFLKSKDYRKFCRDWKIFLTEADSMPESMISNEPAGKHSDMLIIEHAQKVIELGRQINNNSPDKALHKLRIECKKLRYLMELFAPVYDDKLSTEITVLKNLQTILGNYNDLSIQIAELSAALETSKPLIKKHPETAAAIGALIAVLSMNQSRDRKKFRSVFTRFADTFPPANKLGKRS